MSEFVTFPKIKRLFRDIVVTEKIDGTNAQVTILDSLVEDYDPDLVVARTDSAGGYMVLAGSRKRYLVPGKHDNFGFAAWVKEHADKLVEILGPGTHYGEWWGQGIQRKYGLDHKRFSLFNTDRWGFLRREEARAVIDVPESLSSVPALYEGIFNQGEIQRTLYDLDMHGSVAAPGFMKPEGVVIFHTHSNSLCKVTLEDDQPKGDNRG